MAEHKFQVEVTAVSKFEPSNEKKLKSWKKSVETAVLRKVIYEGDEYSANIVKVVRDA